MEFLEGETLDGLMSRMGGKLAPALTLAIAEMVLDVLIAAHENGVIHRDIKPGNIFVLPNGTIKVLDFGLARLTEGASNLQKLTREGFVMGSSNYMPPEQARANWGKVDPRSDIFALGAIMFRALSGRIIHEAKSQMDRLLMAMKNPAPPLATVAPEVPAAVAAVVDKAVAFDIQARWANASEMRAAVREARAAIAKLAANHRTSSPNACATSASTRRASPSEKPDGSGESRSSTAITLFRAITGTTSSDRVASSQAICPGNACTSGTSCVVRMRAAAPHTPRSKVMRRQPMPPWYGPTVSSDSPVRR
jgi:serine/threonine-protein kinase